MWPDQSEAAGLAPLMSPPEGRDGAAPILQFGTGRFLQAHVDLFVSEAEEGGDALGSITVVQSTDDPSSSARTRALARSQGFEVIVRGLVDGRPFVVHKNLSFGARALDARTQWPAVRRAHAQRCAGDRVQHGRYRLEAASLRPGEPSGRRCGGARRVPAKLSCCCMSAGAHSPARR